MANAKRCDICGKYYDHYNLKRDPENPNALIFVNVDEDGFYGNDDDDVKDCCPECMESIQEHIESLKPDDPYTRACSDCVFGGTDVFIEPCNTCTSDPCGRVKFIPKEDTDDGER